ncbi:MAG TPA: copper resistance protein CopC [Gaiellaceae bacterium]
MALSAAAAAAPAAWAHARLISSDPADGAVLAQAPTRVTVRFDEAVRVLAGTVVVRNSDRRSVAAGRPKASGQNVTIPLRRLADGDYTVRWRILSDDGHTSEGVFAFAVGAGRAPPVAALSAGGQGPTATNVLSRWLFFAGLLAAAGVALFLPLAWRPALRAAGIGGAAEGALWGLAFAGFLLAFLGASGLVPHHAGAATRFSLLIEIGGLLAIVGATLSAVAVVERRVGWLALLAGVALLPVPSLAGHALDPGQIRPLNVAADLLHVAAAAVWIGGLLALVLALPRVSRSLEPAERARLTAALIPRLSAIALVSVALLAVTGLVRVLSELSALRQLWTSGYGRALLIKTGLLAALVAIGWSNRSRLAPRLTSSGVSATLRRNLLVELALLAGVVTAVAFLTDLAPGRQLARALARPAPTPTASRPIEPPPAGAAVLAGQSNDRAVGLALLPGHRVQATVLGPENEGVDGLSVSFRSKGRIVPSQPCGPGCYRAVRPWSGRLVTVSLGQGPSVRFALPARPSPASRLVARARAAFDSLRSLVIHEHLASSPTAQISTLWRIERPDRLTYVTSEGASAVVIGSRRWDRNGSGPWQLSAQTPLQLPAASWSPIWSDANALGWTAVGGRRARLVSFFDPVLPAWFEMAVDPGSALPLRLEMIAAAHFMHHRYTDFNRRQRIVPPR